MKTTRNRRCPGKLAFALILSCLATIQQANATLESKDLSSAGDGNLTYDTATGFSWLDVTNTYRVSFADVLGGFGGYVTTLGFRYATETEFGTLLVDAGITPGGSRSWDITNINNTRALISLLGITYSDGHTYLTNGILAESPQGGHMAGALAVNDIGEYDAVTGSLSDLQSYFNSIGYGSFLVLESASPVPEPSPAWLFLSGLSILFLRFRRKA